MVSSAVFVLMMVEREGCLSGCNGAGVWEDRFFSTGFHEDIVGGHGGGVATVSPLEFVWIMLDRDGCLSGWN
jgi:hypothetical protein